MKRWSETTLHGSAIRNAQWVATMSDSTSRHKPGRTYQTLMVTSTDRSGLYWLLSTVADSSLDALKSILRGC